MYVLYPFRKLRGESSNEVIGTNWTKLFFSPDFEFIYLRFNFWGIEIFLL